MSSASFTFDIRQDLPNAHLLAKPKTPSVPAEIPHI